MVKADQQAYLEPGKISRRRTRLESSNQPIEVWCLIFVGLQSSLVVYGHMGIGYPTLCGPVVSLAQEKPYQNSLCKRFFS